MRLRPLMESVLRDLVLLVLMFMSERDFAASDELRGRCPLLACVLDVSEIWSLLCATWWEVSRIGSRGRGWCTLRTSGVLLGSCCAVCGGRVLCLGGAG